MSRTKRESLKGCVKMWSWLAQTGCREKHKWPPLFKFGYVYYTCFACDWVWAQGVRPGDMKECAKICPLKNLWPEGCETNEGNSPYDHWRNAKNLEDSKKYAAVIRDGAIEELSKLKKETVFEKVRYFLKRLAYFFFSNG